MPQHYLRLRRNLPQMWRTLPACVAIGALLCSPAAGTALGVPYAAAAGAVSPWTGDSITGMAASQALSTAGAQTGGHFGYSVSGTGDVNGDGYSDIVI